jgi:hypothetical protein
MTNMQDRGRAIEAHHHHKSTLNINVKARAYKCLGLWASELLGITDPEKAMDYAMALVIFEYDPHHQGDAIDKIFLDFKSKNIDKDRYDIQDKLEELLVKAKQEIIGE